MTVVGFLLYVAEGIEGGGRATPPGDVSARGGGIDTELDFDLSGAGAGSH